MDSFKIRFLTGSDRPIISHAPGQHKDEQETIDLSPSATGPKPTKRQKIRHESHKPARRHIKIAEDDDLPDPNPPLLTSHHNDGSNSSINATTRAIEPIEIDSDEAISDAVPSPDRRSYSGTHKTNLANSRSSDRSPASLLSTIQDNQNTATTRTTRPTRNQTAVLENDVLEYPDSDAESKKTVEDKLSTPIGGRILTDLRDSERSSRHQKTNDGLDPYVSPYFVHNEHLHSSANKRTNDETMSSEEDEPPVRRIQHMMQATQMPPRLIVVPEVFEYNFGIRGLGGATQIRSKNWAMHVSDRGFKFYDAERKLDQRSEILNDNINNWITEDSTGVIHILVNRPIAKLSSSKQIFITLEKDEGPRFIKMLQNRSASQGVYKKYTHGDKIRKNACISSYQQLVRPDMPGTFEDHGVPNVKTSSTTTSTPHLPELGIPPILESRGGQHRALADPNSPFDGETSVQVHDPAVEHTRKANPIPLPRGRDQGKVLDERHLMVDTAECKPLSVPENMETDYAAEIVHTGRITRAAEQRAVRNNKTSEPLLIYPNVKGQNSVTLYEEDLDRLEPDEFLNDSIVEFYLRYNYDNLDEQQRGSAHVFNTFFYQRLTQKRDKEANYEAVKRWTSKGKGVDLFSKKFVVIPINENLHWYLAVVVNLDKVVFGADVTRALDVSYIQADNEIELDTTINSVDSTPTEERFDTRNVLGDLAHDSPQEQISGAAHGDQESEHVKVADIENIAADDHAQGRIPESPPLEHQQERQEVLEFHDEIKPRQLQEHLSLTEKIRASEKAKQSKAQGATVLPAVVDTTALDNLSLDDSQSEPSQTIAAPSGKATKKAKAKRLLSGFSKPGKHIAEGTPAILILDSLNNAHPRVPDVIKDYLVREAQDKKQLVLNPKQFATSKADLPKQDNYSDCGLFLIQYADTLLKEPNVVTHLLERLKFNNPSAAQAHKRAFNNMFQIDRIPLRRKEMIEQLKALSIPYREQARQQDMLRKHERAVALLEKSSAASNPDNTELDHENSCSLLSTDPMKEQKKGTTPTQSQVQLPSSPTPPAAEPHTRHHIQKRIVRDSQEAAEPDSEPPAQNRLHTFASKVANEDSIDELNCL
ncbi:Ubiquitin-like-specific protease 2 [Taphrina deformans PYCC 5710]|uniref:Ubiquitin-like-specific protease 2 n=1 Tax=Taphrina deformans (strain PYCC 5710 / ATCC 11124 / CBS 356.35 / IMI 108563 / JCM 9778 / NBRC 8474) TaxID=1097556 RepID=R4XC64_TAPDE|nr:Ubiquitin-like-specific protease 2 [Taphrina deformans PYCC 5710]|eukprot:CCG83150.1 Ubiquitin-like-specific protease 2 [Taphrina deformans PYCC 5710]